jgi:hypothetical protein
MLHYALHDLKEMNEFYQNLENKFGKICVVKFGKICVVN